MTRFFAGIDGGQTSTTAVVADENGLVLGRGIGGPADEVGAGPESTRLRDALHLSLANALRAARLPTATSLDAIVAGISGYEGRVCGREPELPGGRVVLMHDAPIAHAGALGGRRGVVVIAGTGSVVYTTDDRAMGRSFGGWGFLFGDEGSAFRLARDAIATLMRAQDDGDATLDGAAETACSFFRARTLRQIARRVYAGGISRDGLAAFAPTVLRLAPFLPLACSAADRLAELAIVAIRAGGVPRVAFCGGVFADDHFRERVRAGIFARAPHTEVVESRYDPAMGALLLAYRESDLAVETLRA